MKIALIGYGKMGHIIEEIALSRGHEVVVRIDRDNQEDFDSPAFLGADVAIEFTTPETAEQNVLRALERGVRVVCGSTGWNCSRVRASLTGEQAFLWSSNFSLGVNILFAINRRLAEMMRPYEDYTPSMTEVHHIHKLDAPSGTAKTLAEQIKAAGHDEVPIESIREGEVPGIHTIVWDSPVDTITLSHSAKSRRGFALGAVIAAEWLRDKTGYHTMEEVMA